MTPRGSFGQCIGMKRFVLVPLIAALLSATTLLAPGARADTLDDVVNQIRDSGGRYRWAAASLTSADCSGLVSVAQSLAMGQAPHRLGDTHTLLAGGWPHAIPGAVPEDDFVIGGNSTHMVAAIRGVAIESRTSGMPFLVGSDASSPFSGSYKLWHVDPAALALA